MEHRKPMKCSNSSDGVPQPIETTLFVTNLHCPSCVNTIEETLYALSPRPLLVSPSVVSHSVRVSHHATLLANVIVTTLEDAGFDIHSAFEQARGTTQPRQIVPDSASADHWEDNLDQAIARWRHAWRSNKSKEKESDSLEDEMGKRIRHAEQCPECQIELKGGNAETYPLRQYPSSQGLSKDSVSPFPSDSKSLYDVEVTSVVAEEPAGSPGSTDEKEIAVVIHDAEQTASFKAELSIVGMTCSSCVGSITSAVEALPWVTSVSVALLTNSATVVFEGRQHADQLVETIEDAGFDVIIEILEVLQPQQKSRESAQLRDGLYKATYTIQGMTCSSCVGSITRAIKQHGWVRHVDVNLISSSGTITFEGRDHLPALAEAMEDIGFEATLNNCVDLALDSYKDAQERVVAIKIGGMYCHHCPTKVLGALEGDMSERLQIEHAPTLEDPILRIRYAADVPTFTIRHILAALQRADAALKPAIYHPPTVEEKSRELQRRERRHILLRLGLSVSAAIPAFVIGIVCMSLLKSDNPARVFVTEPMWTGVSRAEWALFILATPVYFFAADTFHRKAIKEVKILWRPGSRTPVLQRLTRFGSMNMLMSLGTSIAYLSSIAELIMTSVQARPTSVNDSANDSFYFDSVIFLTMFLLMGRFLEAYSKAKAGDAVTHLGQLRPTQAMLIDQEERLTTVVDVDLLEVGDVVRVNHGGSPPFDGQIMEGASSFDESSLTGESRLVSKKVDDTVYSGTVNKGGPVQVRLTSISGTSMLDQIIKAVREGQTRRAPIERAADVITSHFVPFVVAVGILTWTSWLILGESGALPRDWLDVNMGGWSIWSLRFAIAVFVVACPCGIGLAAPTALFVGGGLAAQRGILVKGGGEAFQEASMLDCVVLDKTGTITTGDEPAVTDYERCSDDDAVEVLSMAMALEQLSIHPVAKALVAFCNRQETMSLPAGSVEELPGRGIKGSFELNTKNRPHTSVQIVVGSEGLMIENNVDITPARRSELHVWKQYGKSVVLVAVRTSGQLQWTLAAAFAVADAIRPEAATTISALQSRGVSVWMLSGDNPTTAESVAAQVGIPQQNVIAGVLPEQKAEKIRYLQKSQPYKGRGKKHATVAMVGDGINDSPALTVADVGIAIGSGSDIAISSADFVLVSSNLYTLLTLIDLSRAVFRRIWFNFAWALVYNLIAMPVAAGVLYPIRTGGGGHVRLDPVWASLAMAMSSVSVVSSSLLLRSRLPLLGFRRNLTAT